MPAIDRDENDLPQKAFAAGMQAKFIAFRVIFSATMAGFYLVGHGQIYRHCDLFAVQHPDFKQHSGVDTDFAGKLFMNADIPVLMSDAKRLRLFIAWQFLLPAY